MSDNYLRLFPDDLTFVPTADAAAAAVDLVNQSVPTAQDVRAITHSSPAFIDQGSNLEAIICPACASRLSFYDGEEAARVEAWWHQVTDPLDEANLAEMHVLMLCCHAQVRFTSLKFHWPAGFASFEISILNPGINTGLQEETMLRLHSILGCGLQQIWAHY